jgi:arylsulfatase A-like enzyme
MKELGIYEDSEIIIVADHGEAVSDSRPLTKATAIGLFHKPSGSANTPLVKNTAPVSHKNIPATILKAMNVPNYSDFGTPLDEVDENADIVRYFYKSVTNSGHEAEVYKYKITGNARDFANWELIDKYDVVDYFY